MSRLTLAPELIHAFAPTGTLRAAINLGNPLLAHRDAATGELGGVSVDLAGALAERLGVPLALTAFEVAAKSVEAVRTEACDIGFFAIDPARGEGLWFTAPYVLIEGAYLVRQDSPLQDNAEVDRAGHRVVVGKGSAYDLFLTRALQAATLERAASSQAVVDDFVAQGQEVAAGVRQQLEADMQRHPGLRLLPGAFMTIQQAMGLPRSRGLAAAGLLQDFVETAKRNGAVQAALARHGVQGAGVAGAQGRRPAMD
ncbi:ABC transporter substrate-binding protein [Ideonella livida]|uniref:ABC transporter substrate-binding protein n=1 Tax=Ideonella livida TaxID=2707176 RepID=A0A7C9PII4_9BURK|nr:ABC transporter substrate-binding protein [Ideonella livida]NDY92875.1 ABC transporter substrate-binding protein [Ideonella livida]